MTPERFDKVQARLCAIADAVAELELDELLVDLAKTHAASTLLEPGAYRAYLDAESQLRAFERLARAAIPLRAEVLRQLAARASTLPAPPETEATKP